MTITTEEAELLAERVEDEGGLSITADALRDLAAERDALLAERNAERNARFKAEAEFSHMQRRIACQRRALAKLYAKRHDKNGRLSSFLDGLTAENARLREALLLAIDTVEFWAAYASPNAQERHDLAGDFQKLRAALGEKDNAEA
jgi:hypothetical protein